MVIDPSTTPLAQLKTAVIDIETTGLNVATDRIVDIAVFCMDGLKIKRKKFQMLVDPKINIDKKISQIHKIDNEKVKGQPNFKAVQQEFHDFIGNRIIVGFNVGFDLAILRSELDRYNLPKPDYRHLDIRFLSKILAIPNNQLYLENLAYYFKVSVEHRHSAEGDALITAMIYKNLVPILKEKGIQVLSQAEKYIFDQLGFINYSYSSDWYYPKPPGYTSPKTIKSSIESEADDLEKVDPFPFINSVKNIMHKKILSISEDKILMQAVKKMNENKVGSLLIHNEKNEFVAMVCERDLVRLLDEDKKALALQLKNIPNLKIISCSIDDFVYQAQNIMEENDTRHLAVRKGQEIVGIISNRDFMKRRIENIHYHQIDKRKITTISKLGDALLEIPNLAKKLFNQDTMTYKITKFISHEILAITKKVVEISLKKTEEELRVKAPTPFAVLILGSVGRGETLLSYDQDNALVFQSSSDPETLEKQREWLLHFGRILNENLDKIGIPFCKGEVMIRNPKWCLSLDEWKEQINKWFNSTEKEAILNADIFLDAKFIYGDRKLFDLVNDYVRKADSTYFIKLIGENIIDETIYPFTLLGKLKTNSKKIIDIKKSYLFPINSLARLLALKIGYRESCSTRNRFRAVAKRLNLNNYEIEVFLNIQEISLTLILKEQLNKLSIAQKVDNLVYLPNIDQLTQEKLTQLLPVFKSIDVLVHEYLLKE